MRFLTHDFCIQSAIDDDGFANLLGFSFIEEVAATLLELVLHLYILFPII